MHSVPLHSFGLLKQPFIVTLTSFVTLLVLQTTKHPIGFSDSPSSQTSVPTLQSPSLHSYVSQTSPVPVSVLLRLSDASRPTVNIARLAAMNRIVRILVCWLAWRIFYYSERTDLLNWIHFPICWIMSCDFDSNLARHTSRGNSYYTQLLFPVWLAVLLSLCTRTGSSNVTSMNRSSTTQD